MSDTIRDIVEAMLAQELDDLNVALPARILKYDSSKLRADVELLAKKKLGGEHVTIPPILEVPVSTLRAGAFVIVPPYAKGDVVQVLFNQKALDSLLITGKPAIPSSPEGVEYKREYSLDDAVIVGGLQIDQANDLPDVGENLYIGNIDGKTKVEMTPGGQVIITSDDVKLGGEGASDALAFLDELNSLINTYNSHTHVAPSGTTNVPTQTESTKIGTNKVVAE
ncbi:Gp138 family membrane-puncturing spike protein [Natroniella sp. ANB-PHB2]|uniref:Gp138 family membrane-puncturing spike protein n=1 Tax=Natroniella sp. ANB-PHB2 TaxID=3384444 RepID=UPI0038D50412